MKRFLMGLAGAGAAALAVACSDPDADVIRGRGLRPAQMADAVRAGVYATAARSAFEVNDQSLYLLLDPRFLPRRTTETTPDSVSRGTIAELERRGVTKGLCSPPDGERRGLPECAAPNPGYIVRFSDVLTRGGDTVQVYMSVEQYTTPNAAPATVLEFERVYQLVRANDRWRAVREGRVPRQ